MSELTDRANNTESMANANNPAHYRLIVVAVIVGMAGVLLRFVMESPIMDTIADVLLIIGSIISLKAVFRILG